MMSQDVVERTKAAGAQGSEASRSFAWHEAKKLEPAQGWRLGVEILEALDMDVRAFTWAPLMLEGAEVHVLPNVLKGR